MVIYGISGLGADERVYQELNIFLVNKIIPLPWLQPKKNELLKDYLLRFKNQINESEEFVLVGVSFGGMVAVELSKYSSPSQTIIISSNATKSELPKLFRLFRYINVIPLLPNRFLKPPMFLSNWVFGIKSPQYKTLLKQVIADTDVMFLRWAIKQIINWKNTIVPEKLIRIHGTADRLLKMNKKEETIIIKNGGHFMIIENAEEVAKHIERIT
jgi:pimeloyl-ACP methyl ester carboxylesterase